MKTLPQRMEEAPPLPASVDALLGPAQVCVALGLSVRKLNGMVSAGEFPGPDLRLGDRSPRWRSSTVNRWIEERSGK